MTQRAALHRRVAPSVPEANRLIATMDFDGDNDWALSGEAWGLILAAADQVVDDYKDDLEELRAGTQAFGDTAIFQQLLRFISPATMPRLLRPS